MPARFGEVASESRRIPSMTDRSTEEGVNTGGSFVPTLVHDDICITGFSGRLPESSNIDEFKKNLFDGVDMVNNDPRRWPAGRTNGSIFAFIDLSFCFPNRI